MSERAGEAIKEYPSVASKEWLPSAEVQHPDKALLRQTLQIQNKLSEIYSSTA